MDIVRNPVISETNWGQRIGPSWNNELGVIPSHQVVVDSRIRDLNYYPSAAEFEVQLRSDVKSVYSIEVLSIMVPISAATGENWVALEIEGMDSHEGVNSHDGSNSTGVYDSSILIVPLIREDFGPSGASRDVAWWRRNEKRAIKYFKGRKGQFNTLKFRLNLFNGPNQPAVLYPGDASWDGSLAPEHNILIQLDIVAQN